MAQTTAEIKTAPYKWMGEFYGRLAQAYGCTHERKYKQIPGKFNDSRTGGAYYQNVTGDDKSVATVERIAEFILKDLERVVRAEFPGPSMFAKNAAAKREKLMSALDVVTLAEVKEGTPVWP